MCSPQLEKVAVFIALYLCFALEFMLWLLDTFVGRESYCDVTLACDGKFYPVHKLVLSTCSDYFEQIQTYQDLSKAAECLRIKGLAVPDEAPSERDASQDGKRNVPWSSEGPDAKRRKPEEPVLQKPSQNTVEKLGRELPPRPQLSFREPFREPQRSREPLRLRSSPSPVLYPSSPDTQLPSATGPTSSPDVSHTTTHEPAPSAQADSAPPPSNSDNEISGAGESELIMDEPLVKEEPHDDYSEADETKESIKSTDSEAGLSYPVHSEHSGSIGREVGGAGFNPQGLRSSSQPQTMEDLVAQALPGASGLQGKTWEGDRNLLGIPFEGFSGNQGSQMAFKYECLKILNNERVYFWKILCFFMHKVPFELLKIWNTDILDFLYWMCFAAHNWPKFWTLDLLEWLLLWVFGLYAGCT
nr:uncharacterized protein LOC113818150 [Penaeus vannamei]